MFYVIDSRGIYQPYVSGQTRVGLRTEPIKAAQAVGAVGPHWEQADAASTTMPNHLAAYAHHKNPPRRLFETVAELMSTPVVNVLDSESLASATALLRRSRVRHLPVVSNQNEVVGIISERDLLRLRAELSDQALSRSSVRDHMTPNVLTARPEAGVRDVARIMFEAKIGAMPIVDESGVLCGIITRSDILRAIVAHAPLELWG